jgi:23S rRNA (guanosine2251-2'-O)-methyltransferase
MTDVVWIWGRHPVLEAIRAGIALRVLLSAGLAPSAVIDEIRRTARNRGLSVESVESQALSRLASGGATQGVAAAISPRPPVGLKRLLDEVDETGERPFLLLLDQIQDPHNLGAILRTADAAGAHGAVLPERRSAPLGGVVAKTSAGAIYYLRIAQVPNLARAMDEIRERGIWTVGLDGSASTTTYESDLSVPLALVLGSEGSGLRKLTRQHCDLLLRVPMMGHVESLNVSVAAGIAMYETVRQRAQAPARSARP